MMCKSTLIEKILVVSVKFLMVGESNCMVGCHLMAKDHSIQLGVWAGGGGGALSPQQVQGSDLVGVKFFLEKFFNIGLKRCLKG